MSNALACAPWLNAMARVFDRADAPIYLVGGAVRNPLMGLPLSDIDVCGPLRPEAVCALCEGTPVTARLRAAHFGTVELHLTDGDGAHRMAEYTTFREDSYRCGHRPECVRFTTDIAVDALRRDFSVNALYRRLHEGALDEVIDPTGGLRCLEKGILHTVTPDPDRVLGEDGLRILRAARFQAELDLRPTPELTASLARHAPLLGDIALERLRDELQKTLLADLRYPMLKRRAPGTASGLKTIFSVGAWPYLFESAPFDAQAVEALERADGGQSPLPLRMALLLRGQSPERAGDVMRRLRFSQRDTALTMRCLTAQQGIASGTLAAFDAAQLGTDALEAVRAAFCALGDTAALERAEALGRSLAGAPLSLRELAISGEDLKPLFAQRGVPMREMGSLLHMLWRMAVEKTAQNTRDDLLAAASKALSRESRG